MKAQKKCIFFKSTNVHCYMYVHVSIITNLHATLLQVYTFFVITQQTYKKVGLKYLTPSLPVHNIMFM